MAQKAADSDIRMMIATQVAYLDGDEGMMVGELVDRIIYNYDGKSNLSQQQQDQLNTAKYIQEKIGENGLSDCYRWTIKSVANDNAESGFYACLIDTCDGDAIIGFRGSESFDKNQTVNDWISADIGLLNNDGPTEQQKKATQYTEWINDKFGETYNNFSFTGHSLGGNLAEHATIMAPVGMSIYRCLNLDGPGYSDEYMQRYKEQIAGRSKYIDHYQYSWVGTLLNPLAGTNYRTIEAHNDPEKDGLDSYLFRHSTSCIDFGKNGNAKDGTMDELSQITGPISRGIENNPVLGYVANTPLFATLWTIFQTGLEKLAGMADQASKVISSIGNVLQNVRQGIQNWFRSMFGVKLTGEFEVNINYLNSLGDEMDETGRKFRRISSEVSNIAATLRYDSLTGSYYRSRLRSISSKIGNDQGKANSLANAVRSCGSYASSSDAKAGQIFKAV